MTAQIRSLSVGAAKHLRSTTNITDMGDIAMGLLNNSTGPGEVVVFSYTAANSLNQRIAQIHGACVAQNLDFISLEYGGYSLYGSISKAPIVPRIQHVFVASNFRESVELIGIARQILNNQCLATGADADELALMSAKQPPDERIRLETLFDELSGMLMSLNRLPPELPISAADGISILAPPLDLGFKFS
ncbi:hypothetical protein GGI11_004354 [Coemansia sp. RSA 2049]|nr:hypothetical protein GGI11_004354 [Coemansia sp. RSA 2049]